MTKILGWVLLLLGVALAAVTFWKLGKLDLLHAVFSGSLIGGGAWILDPPDMAAFTERLKSFMPGARP